MVVDCDNPALGNFVVKESKGFLVVEVKSLLDTGSCSAMISLDLKSGVLSLGHKEMCINTTIGTLERLVEEVKISMLEANGKVRNIRSNTSVKQKIGPDHLLHAQGYDATFEQLGIPQGKRHLFDIPVQGDIDLLIGLSSADLLGQPIEPRAYGFLPPLFHLTLQ